MATTAEIFLGVFSVSSEDRFQFTITKDETAWTDITGMTIVFESPDRETQIERTMVQSSPGVWYYDRPTTELNTVGRWTVSVRTTGPRTKRYPYEIAFEVADHP